MHISSVIKISFCRISFSGHQNKFCARLDSTYGSRVILVMCKNCSDISWRRLNLNQSKTNCPKNLNSDGLIFREMGHWPECIFRSLLQFLLYERIWYIFCPQNPRCYSNLKTGFLRVMECMRMTPIPSILCGSLWHDVVNTMTIVTTIPRSANTLQLLAICRMCVMST